MTVHASAAVGYQAAAAVYERARPGYAHDAIRALVRLADLRAGRSVLDVGAGTGKWSSAVAAAGCDITCVEPVPAMRAVLEEVVPAARIIAGTAEVLPCRTASVDAVTVAAAIHWFDLPAAVPELVRVVRPGGHVVVVRNQRDPSPEWVRSYDRIIARGRSTIPTAASVPWRETLSGVVGLEPVADASYPNDQCFDRQRLVDRTLSISSVAALSPAARAEVVREVERLAAALPDTFTMPCSTEMVVWRRQEPERGAP